MCPAADVTGVLQRRRHTGMRGYVQEKRERCMELAEKAEKEQDPKNLLALIIEPNRVLAERSAFSTSQQSSDGKNL